MPITQNWKSFAARPSMGKKGLKDWSERSKHRQGTIRRHNQIINTPMHATASHQIKTVSRITTGHDGKVYGYVGKQLVKRIAYDVWSPVARIGDAA